MVSCASEQRPRMDFTVGATMEWGWGTEAVARHDFFNEIFIVHVTTL